MTTLKSSTVGGIFGSQTERVKLIAYWVTTLIIVWELGAGGVWDVLQIPYVRDIILHLGYPTYFLVIMGIWKVPGAVVLLAPRLPRLKEWAYAGAFFTYFFAAASHLIAGDNVWVGPAGYGIILLVSYFLRPSNRRLAPNPTTQANILTNNVA
jgi:DoxX-like family